MANISTQFRRVRLITAQMYQTYLAVSLYFFQNVFKSLYKVLNRPCLYSGCLIFLSLELAFFIYSCSSLIALMIIFTDSSNCLQLERKLAYFLQSRREFFFITWKASVPSNSTVPNSSWMKSCAYIFNHWYTKRLLARQSMFQPIKATTVLHQSHHQYFLLSI